MTRLAIAAVGDPLAPDTWSGVPAGLARGLKAYGVDSVAVDATPPAALRVAGVAASAAARRSRVDAWYTRGMHALRDATGARRLRAAGAVDAAVVCGAEFSLPHDVPQAIWADLTVVQARRHHPVFARLSEGTFTAWRERQDRAYRSAAGLAAASAWTARSMIDDHGADAAKVHVVGFGINHAAPERRGGWDSPRFLFVGREWERKNGPAVVRAFAAVHAEHPDARLDLVGGHPPVEAPGVTGHGVLRLTDERDAERARDLFARATCFVMPSECEPFGIAYAEAGAAGVPSIATAVGGPETILGRGGGILVAPGDERALVDAMRRMADGATARRMGEAARERARLFTWEAVAGRMLRALAPPGIDLDSLPPRLEA